MTKLTGCRFTVREDPPVAISRRGFVIHLSAETRPWPCPSGVFACRALLIGSEWPHFLAPAVLPFPIHAVLRAAGLPLDTQCQVSNGNSHCPARVPRLSPAARWPRRSGPTRAKDFQDLSTAARFVSHSPPAIRSLCDTPPSPRSAWPPTPG